MPKFIIYEVQNESSCRKWRYEVECETEEQAIALAQDGELEAFDDGSYGDSDLHDSGMVVREEKEDAQEAYHAAFNRLCGNGPIQ